MNKDDLIKALQVLNKPVKKGEFPPLWPVAMNGHCDAFALALKEILDISEVPCEIVLISRERFNENGRRVENVLMSHVVINAFETEWDFEGPAAADRREDDWMPEAGFDDEFLYKTVTEKKLRAIRKKESGGKDVDPVKQKMFFRALQKALKEKPVKNKECVETPPKRSLKK